MSDAQSDIPPIELVRAFISHRHEDSEIARVVASHLEDWGVKHDQIFRSTASGGGAPQGGILTEELEEELTKVNLLILIYTFSDKDWARCMWECGVAAGKSTVETRIVVFQCAPDTPRVFEGRTLCKVNPSGITEFTNQFHRKPGFIPFEYDNRNVALAPDTRDDVIDGRANRFLGELEHVIPKRKIQDRHLWDFLRLRLNVDSTSEILELVNDHKEIKSGSRSVIKKQKDIERKINEILKENLTVLEPKVVGPERSNDAAIRQFGFQTYQPDMKLESVIDHWRSRDNTKNFKWIDDLYSALRRAIFNEQSSSTSNYFKSVREKTDWWFLPILTRVRGGSDGTMEFDLYLIMVPSPLEVGAVSRRPRKLPRKRTPTRDTN